MANKRDPAVTSFVMSKIKSKNTRVEKLLGKEMWKLGLRYRKHYPLAGKPDFAFLGPKVVVFCDGDFWHGRNFQQMIEQGRFNNNRDYWIPKLSRTIERDKRNVQTLTLEGWYVIRLWESEILKSPYEAALYIYQIVQSRKR